MRADDGGTLPVDSVPAVHAKAPLLGTITTTFISEVRQRLEAGKSVHRPIPGGGRIHIDRQLPFLVVYRTPRNREDPGTDQFVRGEASHLTVPDSWRQRRKHVALVDEIVSVLSASFGSFLIIEVWTSVGEDGPHEMPVQFRIVRSKTDGLTSTANVLEDALGEVKTKGELAQVESALGARPAPPGMPPVLSTQRAKELHCSLIGIEIRPVFRDLEHDQVFPLVRRALHRGVSRAMKKAVFEFTRRRTSHRPPHYQALGRRSFVKAFWDIDERLAKISNSFEFLLQVTPVNVEDAWADFRRRRFESEPEFTSRPLRLDPAVVKRALFQVRLERIEDPTLAQLMRDQQAEIDRKLTMLGDRGTSRFLYGSLQVYGGVDDTLLALAYDILHRVPSRSRDESLRNAVNAEEFARRAEEELAHFRTQFSDIPSRVEIRKDVASLTVSRGHLLVPAHIRIPRSRVDPLLAHEVGTHVVTYVNGRAQRLKQLYVGLPGYEELQEGMAVLAEYLVGGMSRPRLRLLAARVVATHRMIEGASFVEVFRELDRAYDFAQRTAFAITMRVFRGGGFTKDVTYLRGLVRVLDFFREGGDIEHLLVGKFGLEHIPIMEELRWRKMIVKPPLRPRYLDDSLGCERLVLLRDGMTVPDLISVDRGSRA